MWRGISFRDLCRAQAGADRFLSAVKRRRERWSENVICDKELHMSYDVNAEDLVLCVNADPNHVTGEPVPLVKGET